MYILDKNSTQSINIFECLLELSVITYTFLSVFCSAGMFVDHCLFHILCRMYLQWHDKIVTQSRQLEKF